MFFACPKFFQSHLAAQDLRHGGCGEADESVRPPQGLLGGDSMLGCARLPLAQWGEGAQVSARKEVLEGNSKGEEPPTPTPQQLHLASKCLPSPQCLFISVKLLGCLLSVQSSSLLGGRHRPSLPESEIWVCHQYLPSGSPWLELDVEPLCLLAIFEHLAHSPGVRGPAQYKNDHIGRFGPPGATGHF